MGTVILIDDDQDLLDVLIPLLGSEGHDVATATAPQQALQMLDALGPVPCVVLLDLVMPGEPLGAELVAAIHRRNPRARVIVMTAGREHQRLPGAAAALDKPFDLDALLKLVLVQAADAQPA